LLLVQKGPGTPEYALQNIAQPIGVSTYRVTRELPTAIRKELPSVEDLQEVVTKLRSEIEALQPEELDE
jgi:tRNA C32,U32 (ribose-2'-O)-methylase TrmJ